MLVLFASKRAFQDAIDVAGRAAVWVYRIRAVGDQPAVGSIEAERIYRGQFGRIGFDEWLRCSQAGA